MSDFTQQDAVATMPIAPIAPSFAETIQIPATYEERKQETYRIARDRFQTANEWVTYYRDLLGVDGVIRRMFPTNQTLADFEATEEFIQIQQWVAKLREKGEADGEGREPTRVITVRMPKSLHETLRHEAFSHNTSINKLCISKLLQVIDVELIPKE